MIIVHHLNNSRSQRILWLLEELEMPYEIRQYRRTSTEQAPKELLEIDPLGKSPVITDDDITLAESGAIVEYLITKYGNGKFQAPKAGPQYLYDIYYTHYAEGSLMPLLVQKTIFDIVPRKSPFFIRPVSRLIFSNLDKLLLQPEFKKHFALIETHLNTVTTGWFADGDQPTAADFQMIFPLEGIVSTAPDIGTPKMIEYVKRVQDRNVTLFSCFCLSNAWEIF